MTNFPGNTESMIQRPPLLSDEDGKRPVDTDAVNSKRCAVYLCQGYGVASPIRRNVTIWYEVEQRLQVSTGVAGVAGVTLNY